MCVPPVSQLDVGRERIAHEQTPAIMKTTITLKKTVAHPYFSLACVVAVLFVLPRYGGIATMVGCATVLSAYVSTFPDRFRSRSGSLTPAVCLVTAMWAAAAVIAVLSLTGGLRD